MFQDSRWTYNTGATGAAGLAVIAASGGAIYLNDPAQKTHRMLFGGLGADLSLGFRIPRMPTPKVRGNALAGAGSVIDFPSTGRIMRSDKLGREPQRGDFRGAVLFVEGGGGLIAGGSGTAMLFGINSALLLANVASPILSAMFLDNAIDDATGVLMMAGMNVGVQAGGGVAGLVGYMF
jgi:hypothetical protein